MSNGMDSDFEVSDVNLQDQDSLSSLGKAGGGHSSDKTGSSELRYSSAQKLNTYHDSSRPAGHAKKDRPEK